MQLIKQFKIEFGFGMELRKDGSGILPHQQAVALHDIESYVATVLGNPFSRMRCIRDDCFN